MNKKSESVKNYPDSQETRIALLEMSIAHVNETLTRIEQDSKEFRKEMRSDFRWIIGLMIMFSTGLLGVMAHGFHWF
jgi:hypothetical protein